MNAIGPGLPSRLDDVLGRALARKPIDRPSRPASILRSLIELSYESSIMATALDVAAARATGVPPPRAAAPGARLRSLIELSYESSIMATALDVAEALATVLPAQRQPGRGALDDVIRRQLADQSVARLTAVTDGKTPSTEVDDGEPEPPS